MPTQTSRLLQAVEALRSLDRDRALALLQEEVRHGPASGDRWKSAGKLAGHIGEVDIAIECARRYSRTEPPTLERLLHYWGELAALGRTDAAVAEVAELPEPQKANPSVLHFLGTVAAERGDFAAAENHYRRALAIAPHNPPTWFALAMIKDFTPGDADLSEMEKLRPQMAKAEPSLYARFLYGLAKAWYDCGEFQRAFTLYDEGARLRQREGKYDPARLERFADDLIRDFTPENMGALRPTGENGDRAIFVNGLPRSGTTLVEQILVSHSQVSDGGEINLLRAALIPTGDYSFAGARNYQEQSSRPDPWGDLARHYQRMLAMRFGPGGRIVDKTLSQSHLMGLLLHTLPHAKVVWLRRDPEDSALSCFRSFFTAPIHWSWSFADIGHYFRIEDRLYQHWTAHFGDRILAVPYEDLVRDPSSWIPRILAHTDLADEPEVYESHKTRRSVRTASVQQVRAPISTSRIGSAAAVRPYMDAFRAAYSR